MYKRSLQIPITIMWLLTACAPAGTATPVFSTQQATVTASPIPTSTSTTTPTATLTASITPLPTIPTFTPTFDVSTIVTVTPARKAKCPKTISVENPDLEFLVPDPGIPRYPKATEKGFLEFLNKYDPVALVTAIQNKWGDNYKYITAVQDFTNDGVSELAMGIERFYIFGCKNGQYETLLEFQPNQYSTPAIIFSVEDNNHNGITEITFLIDFDSHGGKYYQIYEWNGDRFANLIPSGYHDIPDAGVIRIEGSGELYFEDIDNDFVKELISDTGIPIWDVYYTGLPWRNERTYYRWNGQQYAILKREFSQPEFRFQAVQDGDDATLKNLFDKAQGFYQEAIFSETLMGYSPEIRENLQKAYDIQRADFPTPTPYPVSAEEYPRLAAYAYYRIMLLHAVQGNASDAGKVYNTLQQKFGSDPYGRPYVEMATAFWETYQSTHKMYGGCAAAIQYAAEHPEILIPLGSDYHGSQSHTYVPADVCPFR